MRTFINLALLLCVLPLISNCTSGNENERTSRELSLRAAIATTCTTEITFNDLDDNVYAYRADDLFGVPSVQAGGHSDPDQLTDLGVNVFADLESLDTGIFSIDGGNALPGTACGQSYRPFFKKLCALDTRRSGHLDVRTCIGTLVSNPDA